MNEIRALKPETMVQCPCCFASLEAIKFPTGRKYEVLMLPQFCSSWSFVGAHSETTFSKIIRLKRQINILW